MQATEAYRLIGDYTQKRFIPYEYQCRLWNLLTGDQFKDLIGVALLSGTGSGKTEAMLLPALFNGKRLIMVYPARSLVEDQIQRAKEYIRAGIAKEGFAEKTLIIDLGNRKEALKIRKFDRKRDFNLIREKLLFRFKKVDSNGISQLKSLSINGKEITNPEPENVIDEIEDEIGKYNNFEIKANISPQSRINIKESSGPNTIIYKQKKHYYGGDIILTTLDEFLFRFLGYGGRHNLLYPYRLIWGYRAKRDLIVAFDEAHSYENVAYTNFFNLISSLISNGIRTVVMSATLPDDFIKLAKQKFGFHLIKGENFAGRKEYEMVSNEGDERNEKILEYINKNLGKKTIVVRNTVRNAFHIFNKIAVFNEEKKCYQFKNIPVFFYHGRLFSRQRSRIYKNMKRLDKGGSPYILVTTHAIEVGCDLDSEMLVTDFCNPDQLIQRAGRCARHKDSKGRIYIIGEDFTKYDDFLKNLDIDYEEYVRILKEGLENGVLPQEQIRERIIKPRLEKDELSNALFSFLSAFIYDFDRNREELHNSGLVITRSWTPSAKFFWLRNYEISDLKKLFAEKKKWIDVLETLKENDWLYNSEGLSVSLELMASQEIDKKDLSSKVLIVSYSSSKSLDEDTGEGLLTYSRINPYFDEILVFYNNQEFPNINPVGAGLVSVPKIFKESSYGMSVRLDAPSQFLLGKNKNLRLRYLAPSSRS